MKGTIAAHYAEYYGLRSAVGVLRRMSFERAGDIGELIGALGYSPFGIRRGVVEREFAVSVDGGAGRGGRLIAACFGLDGAVVDIAEA